MIARLNRLLVRWNDRLSQRRDRRATQIVVDQAEVIAKKAGIRRLLDKEQDQDREQR